MKRRKKLLSAIALSLVLTLEIGPVGNVFYNFALSPIGEGIFNISYNATKAFAEELTPTVDMSGVESALSDIDTDLTSLKNLVEQDDKEIIENLIAINENIDTTRDTVHTDITKLDSNLTKCTQDIIDAIRAEQHQYRVAHVYSLNNVWDTGYRPYASDVPYLDAYVYTHGKFANVYTGYWDAMVSPIDKAGKASRAYEILGYDVDTKAEGIVLSDNLVRVEGSGLFTDDANTFTVKFKKDVNLNVNSAVAMGYVKQKMNEDAITWSDAVQLIYKAMGQTQYRYQNVLVKDSTITPETSPLAQTLSGITTFEGYDYNVFTSRSNAIVKVNSDGSYLIKDYYWDQAIRDGMVNSDKQNTPILGYEFWQLAQRVMYLYGEEVISDNEIKTLLQVYGDDYPIELGVNIADAWAYLKVRGCLNVEMPFASTVSLADALDVAMCIKDKDSRSDYKVITVTTSIDNILVENGYYPVSHLSVSSQVSSSVTLDYAMLNTYDYYLWHNGVTGSMNGTTPITQYLITDGNNKAIDGATCEGIEVINDTSYIHVKVPKSYKGDIKLTPLAYDSDGNRVTNITGPDFLFVPSNAIGGGIYEDFDQGSKTFPLSGLKSFNSKLNDKWVYACDAERAGVDVSTIRTASAGSNPNLFTRIVATLSKWSKPVTAEAASYSMYKGTGATKSITFKSTEGSFYNWGSYNASQGWVVDTSSPNYDAIKNITSMSNMLALAKAEKHSNNISEGLKAIQSYLKAGHHPLDKGFCSTFTAAFEINDAHLTIAEDVHLNTIYTAGVDADPGVINSVKNVMDNHLSFQPMVYASVAGLTPPLVHDYTTTLVDPGKTVYAEFTINANRPLNINGDKKLPYVYNPSSGGLREIDNTPYYPYNSNPQFTQFKTNSTTWTHDEVDTLINKGLAFADAGVQGIKFTTDANDGKTEIMVAATSEEGLKLIDELRLDGDLSQNASAGFLSTGDLATTVVNSALKSREQNYLVAWSNLKECGICYDTFNGKMPTPALDGIYYFQTYYGMSKVDNTNATITVGNTFYNLAASNGKNPILVYYDTSSKETYIDVRCIIGANSNVKSTEGTSVTIPGSSVGSGKHTVVTLSKAGVNNSEVNSKQVNVRTANDAGATGARMTVIAKTSKDGTSYTAPGTTNNVTYWPNDTGYRLALASDCPISNYVAVIRQDERELSEARIYVWYPKQAFDDLVKDKPYPSTYTWQGNTYTLPQSFDIASKHKNLTINGSSLESSWKNPYSHTYDELANGAGEWYERMSVEAALQFFADTGGGMFISDKYIMRYFDVTNNSCVTTKNDDWQNSPNLDGNALGAIYWTDISGFIYNLPTASTFDFYAYLYGCCPLPFYTMSDTDPTLISMNLDYWGSGYYDKAGDLKSGLKYGDCVTTNGIANYIPNNGGVSGGVSYKDLFDYYSAVKENPNAEVTNTWYKVDEFVPAPTGMITAVGGSSYNTQYVKDVNKTQTMTNNYYIGGMRVYTPNEISSGGEKGYRFKFFSPTDTGVAPFGLDGNLTFTRVIDGRSSDTLVIQPNVGLTRTLNDNKKEINIDDIFTGAEISILSNMSLYKVLRMLDTGIGWLMLICFYIVPLLGMAYGTVLAVCGFGCRGGFFRRFCTHVFDVVKLITFGKMDCDTLRPIPAIIIGFSLTLSNALICNGNLYKIIQVAQTYYFTLKNLLS